MSANTSPTSWQKHTASGLFREVALLEFIQITPLPDGARRIEILRPDGTLVDMSVNRAAADHLMKLLAD
jgi:hypothetical protein